MQYIVRNLTSQQLYVPLPINKNIKTGQTEKVDLSEEDRRSTEINKLVSRKLISIEEVVSENSHKEIGLHNANSDNLSEGKQNLYFTQARVGENPQVVKANLHILDKNNPHKLTTDGIPEGEHNKYFTKDLVSETPAVLGLNKKSHVHQNHLILDGITDVGSSIIISDGERENIPSKMEKRLLADIKCKNGDKLVLSSDDRLENHRKPCGEAHGDLSGEFPSPKVVNVSTLENNVQGDGVLFLTEHGVNSVKEHKGVKAVLTAMNGEIAWEEEKNDCVSFTVKSNLDTMVGTPVGMSISGGLFLAKADTQDNLALGVVSKVSGGKITVTTHGMISIPYNVPAGDYFLSSTNRGRIISGSPTSGIPQRLFKNLGNGTVFVSIKQLPLKAIDDLVEINTIDGSILKSCKGKIAHSELIEWKNRLGFGTTKPKASFHIRKPKANMILEGKEEARLIFLTENSHGTITQNNEAFHLKSDKPICVSTQKSSFKLSNGSLSVKTKYTDLTSGSLNGFKITSHTQTALDIEETKGLTSAISFADKFRVSSKGDVIIGDKIQGVSGLSVCRENGGVLASFKSKSGQSRVDIQGDTAVIKLNAHKIESTGNYLSLDDVFIRKGNIGIGGQPMDARGKLAVELLDGEFIKTKTTNGHWSVNSSLGSISMSMCEDRNRFFHVSKQEISLSADRVCVGNKPDGMGLFSISDKGLKSEVPLSHINIDVSEKSHQLKQPVHQLLSLTVDKRTTHMWGTTVAKTGSLMLNYSGDGACALTLTKDNRMGVNNHTPKAQLDVIGLGGEFAGSFSNPDQNGHGVSVSVNSPTSSSVAFKIKSKSRINKGDIFSVFADGSVRSPALGNGAGMPIVMDQNGFIRVETSTATDKENICDYATKGVLEKVLKLTPSTYTRKSTGIEEVGLIAENVHETLPELVVYGDDGEILGVNYSKLSVVLLQAVREMSILIGNKNA